MNEALNWVPLASSLRCRFTEVKAVACRNANLLQRLTARIMRKMLSWWWCTRELRQFTELSHAEPPASGSRNWPNNAQPLRLTGGATWTSAWPFLFQCGVNSQAERNRSRSNRNG
jgi:hypothetical protein